MVKGVLAWSFMPSRAPSRWPSVCFCPERGELGTDTLGEIAAIRDPPRSSRDIIDARRYVWPKASDCLRFGLWFGCVRGYSSLG